MPPEPPPPLRAPREVARDLAARLRHLRLLRNWKCETLARRSGVSPASLKRFENQGKISLGNLLALCEALGRLHEVDDLLSPPRARTLEELEEEEEARPVPKRGRR